MAVEASDGQPGLVRRAIDVVAPDGAGVSTTRRVGGVMVGGAGIAVAGAGVTGLVDIAAHNAGLLATADPYLITAGVSAAGIAVLAGLASGMTDDTARHSAEERAHYQAADSIMRRVQSGSASLAVGSALLGGVLDTTGVMGAHAGDPVLIGTAVAAGAVVGATVFRRLTRGIRGASVHQLGGE